MKKNIFRSFSLAISSILFCSCASVVESTSRQFLVGPLDHETKAAEVENGLSRTAYLKGQNKISPGLSGKGSSGNYVTGSRVTVTAITPVLEKLRAGAIESSLDQPETTTENLCFDFKIFHLSYQVREGELDPFLDWKQWKLQFVYDEKKLPLSFLETPVCAFVEHKKESVRRNLDNTCVAKICVQEKIDLLKPFMISIEIGSNKDLVPLVFGWDGAKKK